jgi:serine/threonine-protein kinase RsbW
MILPNDTTALLPVLAFVEELTHNLGLGERDQMSVRQAMEEAITNVIEHAFEPGEKETFDIAFQTDSSKIIITIREKGIPFQPGQIAGQDADTTVTPESPDNT